MEHFNNFESNPKVLWNDKKRFLGMPITFTRYEVSDDRLIKNTGLLKSEIEEILLYRILDLKMTQTLGQKIFNVGTITLFSADKSTPNIKLESIKDPDKVRRFLSKLVEEKRDEKRIIGREMYGTASDGCTHDDNDSDFDIF